MSSRVGALVERLLVGCVAVVVWGAGASVAVGSGWVPIAAAVVPGLPDDSLSAVSCVSVGECVAVGDYVTRSSGQGPLVERRIGGRWSVVHVPVPEGASSVRLRAVSCFSSAACVAVGEYDVAARAEELLVERWDGKLWAAQSLNLPVAGGSAVLLGVSCASASMCLAVGEVSSSSVGREPFSELWNGRRWTAVATPSLAERADAEWGAVSCSSGSACTAVGDQTVRSARLTFVERWNGSGWQVQRSPSPVNAGASGSLLAGVSCPSRRSCFAAGYFYPDGLSICLR